MGDQIESLQLQQRLKCHHNITQFCITQLSYNRSLHHWDMVQRHTQGAIHQNITIDVPQRKVLSVSQQSSTFDIHIKDWNKFAGTQNN